MNLSSEEIHFEFRFTQEYSQPDDYHFCQDSVIFSKFVASRFEARGIDRDFRALDICAGCGILGLELSHFIPEIESFDFLEIQEVFRPHFLKNLNPTARSPEKYRFVNACYSSLLTQRPSYDLIIANPPYFEQSEGWLSPSTMKNRCRFFIDSDLKTLLKGIACALKPDGVAYVLMKSGEKHGRKIERDLSLWLMGSMAFAVAAEIRGTQVIQITHACAPDYSS